MASKMSISSKTSTDGTSRGRKVTPPSPSYMSQDQFANYLSDLRSNRTARPGGARPQPNSRASTYRHSLKAASAPHPDYPEHRRSSSRPSSTAAVSVSSRLSSGSTSVRGRDYYPTKPTVPLKPSQVIPTSIYMERGQRWMEKEEAVSLREAMEHVDLEASGTTTPAPDPCDEEERRIYHGALNEAAELVWKHEHPGTTARPDGPYRYRPHLRKNSYAHARIASIGAHADQVAPSGLGRDIGSRSASRSSTDSDSSKTRSIRRSVDSGQHSSYAGHRSKTYGLSDARNRRTSLRRSVTGQVERPFSGDEIWEEPEAAAPGCDAAKGVGVGAPSGRRSPVKLGNKPQGPLNRSPVGGAEEHEPSVPKALNRFEIHRNAPSQSRNPQYTTNAPAPKAEAGDKRGVEVRNDDIKAATSKKLRDRSAKLPEPTAVSDSPGRPIVSFDAKWKAPDESADGKPGRPAQSPSAFRREASSSMVEACDISVDKSQEASRPILPCIAVDEAVDERPASKSAVPSIKVPLMVTPDDGDGDDDGDEDHDDAPARGSQPFGGQTRLRGSHWSLAPGGAVHVHGGGRAVAPAAGRTAAGCHECGLAIQGRFVSLAGSSERFHAQCFRCFSCGTRLEAMEISPEPDHVRTARLERIRRRANGETLADDSAALEADDGHEGLRFYCHLDWHEKFAPRCKHCKTPIIGEHIVALGAHWHYGHFFCAECGDPFGHGMTHIEKDGYAWCLACQTKRTERRAPKCTLCKTAVLGQYIVALGGEWHEHCFRCEVCRGAFDDGQIFPRETEGTLAVLCTACRTRELKA